jgi:hypothetical protein
MMCPCFNECLPTVAAERNLATATFTCYISAATFSPQIDACFLRTSDLHYNLAIVTSCTIAHHRHGFPKKKCPTKDPTGEVHGFSKLRGPPCSHAVSAVTAVRWNVLLPLRTRSDISDALADVEVDDMDVQAIHNGFQDGLVGCRVIELDER